MPIYEYQCEDCQRASSVFFRTFAAVAPVTCEHCGSSKMRRLISLVAAVHSSGEDLTVGSDDGDHGEDVSDGSDRDLEGEEDWGGDSAGAMEDLDDDDGEL